MCVNSIKEIAELKRRRSDPAQTALATAED